MITDEQLREVETQISDLANDMSDCNAASRIIKWNRIANALLLVYSMNGFDKHLAHLSNILAQSIEHVKNCIKKSSAEINNNQELLKREQQIRREYADLEASRKKVTELLSMKSALSGDQLRKMYKRVVDEKDDYVRDLNELIGLVKKVNQAIETASNSLSKQLQGNLITAQNNLEKFERGLKENLERLSPDPLETVAKAFNEEVNKSVIRYNELIQWINTEKERNEALQHQFHLHFGENSSISEVLKDRSESIVHIDTLRSEIVELLKKFDEELKRTVEGRDNKPLYQLPEFQPKQ